MLNAIAVDADTGEITTVTRYLVIDYRGDRHTLDSTEIDLGCLEPLDRYGCWTACDRLIAGIAKHRLRKRSAWDDRDITDLRHAWNLLVAAL